MLRYSVKTYFSCSSLFAVHSTSATLLGEEVSVKTYFSYVEKFPPFSERRTVHRAVNGPG